MALVYLVFLEDTKTKDITSWSADVFLNRSSAEKEAERFTEEFKREIERKELKVFIKSFTLRE